MSRAASGDSERRISPLGVNPASLVGRRVDVQGLGLGKVDAFDEHQAWTSQDGRHTVTFDEHGRRRVLLRRRTLWAWNDGLEFSIVPPAVSMAMVHSKAALREALAEEAAAEEEGRGIEDDAFIDLNNDATGGGSSSSSSPSRPRREILAAVADEIQNTTRTLDDDEGRDAEWSLFGYIQHQTAEEMRRHLAETEPSSFHQATVYFSLRKESSTVANQIAWLAGSFVLVILQGLVASAVVASATNGGCAVFADTCARGQYCRSEFGLCYNCLEFDSFDKVCATADDTNDKIACCEDGKVVTIFDAIVANVKIMTLFDRITFFLSTLVVAMSAQNEVRDMLICNSSVEYVCRRRRENGTYTRGLHVKRLLMSLLSLLRQLVFLPLVVAAVVELILLQGGSAVDICLNAVAVLFLTELDNAAFHFGMSEHSRIEVSYHRANNTKIICLRLIFSFV